MHCGARLCRRVQPCERPVVSVRIAARIAMGVGFSKFFLGSLDIAIMFPARDLPRRARINWHSALLGFIPHAIQGRLDAHGRV